MAALDPPEQIRPTTAPALYGPLGFCNRIRFYLFWNEDNSYFEVDRNSSLLLLKNNFAPPCYPVSYAKAPLENRRFPPQLSS